MEHSMLLDETVAGGIGESLSPIYRRGLVAWSILMTLFTLIPGIVALTNCLGIRDCMTVEEQEHKADTAFDWCLVGTLLSAIVLVLLRAH